MWLQLAMWLQPAPTPSTQAALVQEHALPVVGLHVRKGLGHQKFGQDAVAAQQLAAQGHHLEGGREGGRAGCGSCAGGAGRAKGRALGPLATILPAAERTSRPRSVFHALTSEACSCVILPAS